MIMYLDGKNAYKSYPIMDGGVGVKKTRDSRDRSNNALISSDYLKLLCDFKSILKYDCNSEEE
jgi:hypothetical protein